MSIDLDLPQQPSTASVAEEHGCRHLLEIGAHLRNLAQRAERLTLSFDSGTFDTRILDVRANSFVFDASRPDAYQALLGAVQGRFTAVPDGVRVEFSVGTPRIVEFRGRPAFEAGFPEVLYYMQRRAYFRVDTPLTEPFLCTGTLADGTPFRFELADLSMSGLCVRTADPVTARLAPGAKLRGVDLHLGQRALHDVTLELMSVRPASQAGAYRLGFRFAELPRSADNTLQRVITELAVGLYRSPL